MLEIITHFILKRAIWDNYFYYFDFAIIKIEIQSLIDSNSHREWIWNGLPSVGIMES